MYQISSAAELVITLHLYDCLKKVKMLVYVRYSNCYCRNVVFG